MDLILGRHALQMAKPALSVELTNTSPESETGPPQQEQPRKPTQCQTSGRGQGYRTPHGKSQPRAPRDQNIHLLHMASDLHPVEYYTDDNQEQCYSPETWQIHSVHTDHAKKKYFATLPMSATGNKFTPVTFQIDTAAT